MAVTRAPTRRAKAATPRSAARAVPPDGEAARLAAYAARGPDCAFANVRVLGRVVGAFYDEMLKPADLRASQLALMWAILACEPVDQKSLEQVTQTDQTTLSRTVQTLRRMRLVSVKPGPDRRVKLLALSATGKVRFAAAMPYWENAQREAGRIMPLDVVSALGKQVHRAVAQAS